MILNDVHWVCLETSNSVNIHGDLGDVGPISCASQGGKCMDITAFSVVSTLVYVKNVRLN